MTMQLTQTTPVRETITYGLKRMVETSDNSPAFRQLPFKDKCVLFVRAVNNPSSD
jgi:hypothetical protein